jgi:hypothetical protein
MFQLVNSLDYSLAYRPFFVTLTYHERWPAEYAERQAHLDALIKRLERLYGEFATIWRVEFKRRKSGEHEGEIAPHFHLLVFVDPYAVVGYSDHRKAQRRAAELRMRNNVAWSWNEIVDPGNSKHLETSTSVEDPRTWNGVKKYMAEYLAKPEKLTGDQIGGRMWGVRRRNLLPISYETTTITYAEAVKLRRAYRKFSKMRYRSHRGELHAVTCFVRHSTTNRLLSWLGIIGTEAP